MITRGMMSITRHIPTQHSSTSSADLRWRGLIAAAALLLATAAGLPAAERFTPGHVARLKQTTAAVISPDGQYVAYGLAVQRDPLSGDDGAAWTELHVVDADGNSRPFISGKVNIGGIQWSPNAKHIAYTAKRNGDDHAALYLLPIDGGESRRLLGHGASISGVAFCQVDDRLAFLATRPVSDAREEHRQKGFNQEIYEEDWRPTQVWLSDLQGSEPRALELEGSASYVAFSPDAKKLVVVLAPTSLVDDSYMFKRVRVVDAETGRMIQLINNPGKLGAVRWSPDGKHLAMISAVDIHDPSEGHLMIAAVPGDGSLRDLTPDLDGHVNSFAWTDQGTVLWIADQHQATMVARSQLDGATTPVLTDSEIVLSGLSVTSDGQGAACLGMSPQHPYEVFRFSQEGEQPQRLTDSNPWLGDMRFAAQEVVSWQARDGQSLEGVLVRPLDYEEGRRYPLIMTVHGGPEAHVSHGWVTSYSSAGQVGASRGFAVFYPNYRGSTGRGVAFSKMGQGDAAGREFDDIVDAIDHLSEIGLVDADRVGITGGSYGGYASAWGSTFYSDRYAASVMFVGISDNVSKVGTTDIPEEMYYVHHRKRLWDDWDYFMERSPIRHVRKNKTPTLIMHGKNDPRVHPSQSLELFRHLKTLGQAPARLVLYEGEGHGNRKAAARLDYNLRMLRWMEHFLQKGNRTAPAHELDYEHELNRT